MVVLEMSYTARTMAMEREETATAFEDVSVGLGIDGIWLIGV